MLFQKRFFNNPYLLGAFAAGAALLAAVLLIPALEPLFSAAALPAADLGAVAGLAFGSMAVIQALKALRRK